MGNNEISYFELWKDATKFNNAMLKKIMVEDLMQSWMLIQILAKLKGQSYDQVFQAYSKVYAETVQKVKDEIWVEFGKIQLKDILPDEEL